MSQMDRWLAGHYGSRRGFALTCWYQLRYLAGSYRSYRQIDWESVQRLVFVCKGNICRSAYAEGVAKSLGFNSISCGLNTTNGKLANERAILAAATRGIDLKEHKTRQIQVMSFERSDLILAMEPWQVNHLAGELGKDQHCTLLGLWGKPVYPHIQDPYGTSPDYFNKCFGYIDRTVHEISKKIRKTSAS